MADLVSNRKAFFNYTIMDTFDCGIVLLGTEVKSIKNHEASIQEAYVIEKNEELWLINASISPYKQGNVFNHEEKRRRKLLLKKKEILKLKRLIIEKSITIIPLSFFLKNGLIKIKIAVAKGKKAYDKRAALKEKDDKREAATYLKGF